NTDSTGSATVTGTGSQWNSSGNLFVGDSGEATLMVEAAGVVSNDQGVVGSNTDSTGSATVTGTGSQWNSSGNLFVGSSGDGTLMVEAAGVVSNNQGTVGFDTGSTGSATVTGVGSQWNNSGTLTVGREGNGTLNILNGGSVTSSGNNSIGRFAGSTGIARVDGMGSSFSGALTVAAAGNGTLTIANGGSVTSSGSSIGDIAGSTGIATVTSMGSSWLSGALVVANAGNGTLFIVNGGSVTSSGSDIGKIAGSTGAVTVDGIGSNWLSGALVVGGASDGTLNIRNGGSVSSSQFFGILGDQAGSTGTVTVDGMGSSWLHEFSLVVGFAGNGTLDILDGGRVTSTSTDESTIGRNSDSSSAATVDGMGSSWLSSGNLSVGVLGNGTLNILNGGNVTNIDGSIGFEADGTGTATVDGMGSSWINGSLDVGVFGNGTLNILNGGSVTNTFGTIGENVGSTGAATVDGMGSSWLTDNSLSVGFLGNGTLNIRNGGSVTNGFGGIGEHVSSTGTATVTGLGSQWNNALSLVVGSRGDGTLNILNGGTVTSSGSSSIGQIAGSTGAATVDGLGSSWLNSGALIVASGGNGTLNIRNGGSVSNTVGIIGDNVGLTGAATVDGEDSSWLNGGGLIVGHGGNGTLNILNGGSVTTTTFASIGDSSTATGTATVDGMGSSWLNDGTLDVGFSGNGTLNILNGGSVTNTDGFIGTVAGATGTATIGGNNALWDSSGSLFVGGSDTAAGGTGALNINSGGRVNVDGTLKVWSAGTVNLDGGSLFVDSLDTDGTFNFNSGLLNINANLLVGAAGGLGAAVTLTDGQELVVGEITTIGVASALTLNGGIYTTNTIINNGSFDFIAGEFNLTNSDLIIGTSGLLGDTVSFNSQQTVNVSQSTVINNDGVLIVESGSLTSNGYANNGEVVINGFAARVRGNTFTNSGLLRGAGRIDATLVNQAGGEVRAGFSDRLLLSGISNTNHGLMNVNFGGTLESPNGLTNSQTGTISGDGIIRVGEITLTTPGGIPTPTGTGLINNGKLNFSGTTKVFGDVWTQGGNGSDIIVSGGAVLTFFDNVTMYDDLAVAGRPEIRAGFDSTVVYFGTLSGDINKTGAGLHVIEGTQSAGFSPGFLSGTNELWTDSSINAFDIAGTTPMAAGVADKSGRHSVFDYSGTLTILDGATIDVDLIGVDGPAHDGIPFSPSLGDSFEILHWATLVANTSAVNFDFAEATLATGLVWQAIWGPNSGGSLSLQVAAVPIPAPFVLMLSALAVIGWRRRPGAVVIGE
ncbi:MAG: fibronectin-binding autotransporter adhesin, partial [Gammaproteobacteria bacterium]